MKKNLFFIIVFMFACLSAHAINWGGCTISSNETVILTDNVTLTGTIIITNGATLTIQVDDGATTHRHIVEGRSGSIATMFSIEAGSKLVLRGKSPSATIVLQGDYNLVSADAIENEGRFAGMMKDGLSSSKQYWQGPIMSYGDMDFQYVILQGFFSSAPSHGHTAGFDPLRLGTIHIENSTNSRFDHCLFRRNYGGSGAGIFFGDNSSGIVEITNSDFSQNCSVSTLRSQGTTSIKVNVSNCNFYLNKSRDNGGAIYWSGYNNGAEFSIKGGCNIYQNYSPLSGGGAIFEGNVKFEGENTFQDNFSDRNGGGISIEGFSITAGPDASSAKDIRFVLNEGLTVKNNTSPTGAGVCVNLRSSVAYPVGSSVSLVVNGTQIQDNHCVDSGNGDLHLVGGGISFINSLQKDRNYKVSVELNGCEITNNYAGIGGGVYVLDTDLTAGGGALLISNNKANISSSELIDQTALPAEWNYGGGIVVKGGTLNLIAGTICDNTAIVNGGGAAVIGNVTIPGHINLQGSTLQSNNAVLGGGVYLNGGNLSVTSGAVGTLGQPNRAWKGAGVYVDSGGTFTMNEEPGKVASVAYNETTTGNSSGLGGGIFMAGGNAFIYKGSVSYNKSELGAGCYINGGAATITGGNINNNESSIHGGGFYMAGGSFTMNNGNIYQNSVVENGGGLYVNGGTVLFNGGSINNNKASNGGALYLASGASMTFTGGIISENSAKSKSTDNLSDTAYNGGEPGKIVSGWGGGIYLEKGSAAQTTLSFILPPKATFGLYTNNASMGGDDIVSEGINTYIDLPRVSEMSLVGFEGQDACPFWYQDYHLNDPGYQFSHAVEGTVQTVDRFKTIFATGSMEYLEHRIPDNRLPLIYGNYLCLTLGFNVINIILTATGLDGNESAMFTLVRHGSGGNTSINVFLVKDAEGNASKTVLNMPWGTYSVYPTPGWNWAYQEISPINNVRLGENDHYEFVFDLHHKNNAVVPMHDEVHN